MITPGIFVLSFVTVCFAIFKILYISHKKHLFDEPSEDRKIHLTKTPNLGGLAIFTTLLFVYALFAPTGSIPHVNYLIAAAVTLITLGVTDDLVGVDPLKKMAAQLLVAFITTTLADIRFTGFYGIWGITAIPYWLSISLSAFFIVFMINAINLIDGINTLAGSIGLLSCIYFSWLFWKLNDTAYLYLSISLCGCLAGFLVYNVTPARIFMGDTGSLFLGFILSVFAIRYLESGVVAVSPAKSQLPASGPAAILGLLIIPIFDTVRVFAVRLWRKKSPFAADRNHIHHLLLDLGLSHLKATGVLIGVNISVLLLTYALSSIRTEYSISAIIVYALTLYGVLWYLTQRSISKQLQKAGNTSPELSPFPFVINSGTTLIVKKDRNSLVEENAN